MEKRNERLEILEDVHEMLTEAIKLVANEPSVGLYFVQHHVQKSAPTLVHLKDRLFEMTADAELATADVKDSLNCIKTMKECGPLVIGRMIKTLKDADNAIPVPRNSMGSVSQFLPKPVRPPGLGKSSSRSSFLHDNSHSDSSSRKGFGSFQKARPSAGLHKESDQKPILPAAYRKPDHSQRTNNLNQLNTVIPAGFDSSANKSKDADIAMTTEESSTQVFAKFSSSMPLYHVHDLLDSAISIAETVGHGGIKLIRNRVTQPVNDNRVHEQEHHFSDQPDLMTSKDLLQICDNFEEFQAHHVAKLEAWLNENNSKDEAHSE